MSAATLHVKIKQGARFYRKLVVKQAGSPINITGWSFDGEVRKQRSPTAALIATFSFNLSNPTQGEVEMTIDSSDTESLEPGKWPYDVEYDDGTGEKRDLLEGYANVVGQVTAAT